MIRLMKIAVYCSLLLALGACVSAGNKNKVFSNYEYAPTAGYNEYQYPVALYSQGYGYRQSYGYNGQLQSRATPTFNAFIMSNHY